MACDNLVVTFRNESAPVPFKVRVTDQPPMPFCGDCADAPVRSVPSTAAGSNRYLAVPSCVQVTIQSVGISALPPESASLEVQLSAANWACRAGLLDAA